METDVKAKLPIWIHLLSFGSGLVILGWPITFYLSIFLFDAPDSGEKLSTWLVASAFWFYPIVVIGLIIWGRKLYRVNRWLGTGVIGLPLLVLLIVAYTFYETGENSRWGYSSYEKDSDRALIEAVINGDLEDIERLIVKDNANINATNSRGHTPLIASYEADQMDSFKLLLRLGADLNLKPKDRVRYSIAGYILSDLKLDETGRKVKYLDILFENGLSPTLADDVESLFHLTTDNDPEIMSRFLDLGVDYNLKLKWGTPLEYAMLDEDWDNVIALLKLPNIEITEEAIKRFNKGKRGFDGKLLDNGAGRKEVYNFLVNELGIDRNRLLTE